MASASHFIWRDSRHVLVWAQGSAHKEARFYLCQDQSQTAEILAPDVMTLNSHVTYLPRTEGRWLLNDTYVDKQRFQSVYLFQVETGRRIDLGRFYSPPHFIGPLRCDLHPRASRDGTKIVFDSPHETGGRQMYMIDIGSLPI
jgi:hypothetical protein